MRILGLCGSLRAGSLNAAVLRSAAELVVPPRELLVDPGLGRLPFFDADVETTALPRVVAELRGAVGAADGLLIATPEYAHGTSGVLKNALEWLVGGGEMDGKPVALASASPAATGGDRARAWLAETLAVMGAKVIPRELGIPRATLMISDGRITDEPTRTALARLLDDLADAAAEARAAAAVEVREVSGSLAS
ncbi:MULTISPECIES: NADPH-dependent FMN reductase [Streptomyces]|uniref:NADPH-dependent FMN reductase n=1 Tax=Streptomyces eurythermus TaxID=42237 RepID=A0ABW6Z901_9ACTN|nr:MULTISPECIES: NAD(P)H-dependent oxidoreductase [Streptomyces]QIS70807.1 NAD(P)H-dependent oxidoreductase [Streptomyces sp. DSM 40868]